MAAFYDWASFFHTLAAGTGRLHKHCDGGHSGMAAGSNLEIVGGQLSSVLSQLDKGPSSSKPHLYLVCDALREFAEAYTPPFCPVRWNRTRRIAGVAAGLSPRQLARKARLLREFSIARTYKEKRRISKQLYELEFDPDVEAEKRIGLFDVNVVTAHLCRLERALKADDVRVLLSIVQNDISRDLGGMCNPALYHHFGVKTDPLIDRYQKAAVAALQRLVAVCKAKDQRLDKREVKDVLQETCG